MSQYELFNIDDFSIEKGSERKSERVPKRFLNPMVTKFGSDPERRKCGDCALYEVNFDHTRKRCKIRPQGNSKDGWQHWEGFFACKMFQ